MLHNSSSKGSSTLELLIAFAVLILSITAGTLVVFGNQSVSVDTETNNEALSKAQFLLEDTRAKSRDDFSSIMPQSSVEPSGPISYTKTLDVTDIDSFTKLAKSTVAWLSGGRTLNIVLQTLLTDPNSALGGDTCNPNFGLGWDNPQLLGSADVGQNNGGTDVDVLGKKAYVTADASSAAKHDFYIVDVTDPTISNLPIFGSINTGPGLAAVHVAGKYAYVANMSTVTQLQVIDVSTPSAPAVVASLDVTAPADTAVGNSIFYGNKKVYLGLTKSSGPEFYVLDVSDPLNPSVKASFETNTGINAITMKNNIAYLAVRYGSDGVTPEQLRVMDVSQADSGIIAELNPFGPNPSTMSGEGLYISKDGKTLYLGEGGANPSNKSEFFSLDVSVPSSISQINSKYIPTSNDVTVNAITVRNNLAFLWTDDTNLGFQIWDLNTLSTTTTPYGSLNTQQTATGGLDCDGNLVYTAQRSQKALQIIGPTINVATIVLDIHNAAHNSIPPAAANIGDTIHASVAVTGSGPTPTGKVDFTFYNTSTNCSSGATADSGNPFILNGSGVVDPSSSQGPLNAGSYSFKAHYEGDANYSAADSACKSLMIAKIAPTSVTTVVKPSTTVTAGTVVHDEVTVAGTVGVPTGTVNFQRYKKTDCTGSHTDDLNVPLVSGFAQSSNFISTNGSYCYQVHYNGDVNYTPADASQEPFTVN